ncbi:MAG: NAD(+) diphosphatase [Actinobacteria bacterium]|nr:NAD(+) diphosphatase [Actinomycetota bacterium]
MPNSFLSRLPLSRFEIDRDNLAREREGLFEELWADPATRILPIFQGSALLSSPTSLALLPVDAVPDAELRVYLGRSTSTTSPEPAGTPIVAALLEDAGHLAESDWANLRAVGSQLSDRDAGIFTEALGILNWHASHRFSPRTGEPTVAEKGGWVRRDPVSNTEVFPRTDAAIIVGITDADDRILLGSNALWESNRYSLLAGFVEPGESLESAVIREVFEESGIHVVDPVYLGSQPWPFPASLMLGFLAKVDPAHGTETTPDGAEILDLRWFTRDELAAALTEIRLPGPTSIARAILEEWFGGHIDDGQR